jgi:hypothetical protein
MTLVTGLVGIVAVTLFLGFLVWWIKALPLTIIVTAVLLMLLYDFVRTLRYGDEGARN